MQIACADCGCIVDHGLITEPCAQYPGCCCAGLVLASVDDAQQAEPG